MSIVSFTIRGGTAPWVDTVIEWSGVATTWTLKNTKTSQVLYTGTKTDYDMVSTPETIYWLEIADSSGNKQTAAYVTPPISAPVGLLATGITSSAATLEWSFVKAATTYEVLVDGVSYNVTAPANEAQPKLALGGLIADRTYSAQVRAAMTTTTSLLSPPIYFTTLRTTVAESSVYEFPPSLARTYRPTGGWLADGSQLIHGSGEQWNNTEGIHTTVFMYSAASLASLRALKGVRVLSAQVSLTRLSAYSDPRMVLSHWLLHALTAIPGGAPTFVGNAMGVDSGQAALSQQQWMELPTGWVDAIMNSTAEGFGWGGVSGRYQLAQAIKDPLKPKNGTLRITVG